MRVTLLEKATPGISTRGAVKPWTAASKKFRYLPSRPGVGPGEEKLAAELGGKIMGGSVSYDISLPGNKKLEVKELDQSGQLRTGTEGVAAASQAMGVIFKICDELADLNVATLKKHAKSAYPAELDAFISEDVPLIKKGEMTTPRMLGSDKKFGLLDALKFTSALMRSEHDADQHVVSLDDRDVPVDDVKFAQAADVVGLDDEELSVPEITREISKLRSKAFRDPSWYVDKVWATVAIPSESFPDADALAIVTPDGYRLIAKSEMDKQLVFARISQGRPRFKLA